MMLNETEAQNKWCYGGPMMFLAASAPLAGDKVVWREGRCLASGCMAWRWEMVMDGQDERGAMTFKQTGRGYCGLAGMPMLDRMP